MPTTLEQLKPSLKVVADTGDFAIIDQYKAQDATTNPSLIYKAAGKPEYQHLLDRSIKDSGRCVDRAVDLLLVAFGLEILKIIPARFNRSTSIPIILIPQARSPKPKISSKYMNPWYLARTSSDQKL